MTIVPTDRPPERPATKIASSLAPLQLARSHHLCAGCGHPIAYRILLEVIAELGIEQRAIGTAGHGCYTGIAKISDLEFLQCLHGRSPAAATGIKRVQPDSIVFCVQGDGDLATEGLHEILHAGGRGERITCFMLNNGVFGDTGGQMSATTPVGQRTKTSLAGRDAQQHGYPIPVASLLAALPGVAYVARGAVTNTGAIARTKRFIRDAFKAQLSDAGLSFVEILTMCPTGWFKTAPEGPEYLTQMLEAEYPIGVLKGKP